MPIAQGMMIMDRLNSYNTSTTFNVVEGSPFTCGETVHFHVTVTNISVGTPVPTGGTVQIFDLISNTVLATGTLSSGSVTIPYTLHTGNINVIAKYLGTFSSPIFNPSISINIIPISASLIVTTTSITSPSNHDRFCADANLGFTAVVSSGSGTPTGNVQFSYSNDSISFIIFATSSLSGGTAIATLPGGTFVGSTDGVKEFFQAVYLGNLCFGPSASIINDGYAIRNQGTSISFISPPSGTIISTPGPFTITTQVISTILVNEGFVTLYFAFSASSTPPSNYPSVDWSVVPGSPGGVANNPVTPSSGIANFNFDDTFFITNGTYYFVAVYTGTDCFGNSITNTIGTEAFNIVVAAG